MRRATYTSSFNFVELGTDVSQVIESALKGGFLGQLLFQFRLQEDIVGGGHRESLFSVSAICVFRLV